MIRVKVDSIDYAIEREDLCYCESEEEFIEERNNILKDLPKTMTIDLDCEEDEIEDWIIADEISKKTYWLIYGCTYHIEK